MAQVQIRCPNSGLWASIGLEVDQQAWETMAISSESSRCGVCGDMHTWWKREARVVDWAWA